MSLYSTTQESKPEEGDIHLINPSVNDFLTVYYDDNNERVSVHLDPLESRAFPRKIGLTVLNHLVTFILNQGGFSYKTDVNEERAKIREKCVIYE